MGVEVAGSWLDSITVLFNELANDSESEMTFSNASTLSRYLLIFTAKFSAIFRCDLSKVSTIPWRKSFLNEVISVWSVRLIADGSSDLVIGLSVWFWPGGGPHALSGGGIGAAVETIVDEVDAANAAAN